MTAGILAIWNDCAPAGKQDYERWYMAEHLPERVGLPGFRFARRYERVDADHEYFTFYEVESPPVLASPAYVERLRNPTPSTTAIMPHFRNMSRTVCRKAVHLGSMAGGSAFTVAIESPADAASALEGHAAKRDMQALADERGVCAVQLWSAVPELAAGQTPESALRGGEDRAVAAALILETTRVEEAQRLREGRILAALLDRLDPQRRVTTGVYRLLCVIEHDALVSGR